MFLILFVKSSSVIGLFNWLAHIEYPIFVLDEQLRSTGSEPGELFISGVGLAQGYLNNSELTQAAFIDNPYLIGEKCIVLAI